MTANTEQYFFKRVGRVMLRVSFFDLHLFIEQLLVVPIKLFTDKWLVFALNKFIVCKLIVNIPSIFRTLYYLVNSILAN